MKAAIVLAAVGVTSLVLAVVVVVVGCHCSEPAVPLSVEVAALAAPSPAAGSPAPAGASAEAPSRGELPLGDSKSGRPILLGLPVEGVERSDLLDSFDDPRSGARRHNAIDIFAPRGTPVVAATDGRVARRIQSARGGLSLYQLDRSERYAFFYAHLDRYAEGISAGDAVERGQVIGFVGSTGNASDDVPHLHFAIHRLAAGGRWWQGEPINPFPWLLKGRLPTAYGT